MRDVKRKKYINLSREIFVHVVSRVIIENESVLGWPFICVFFSFFFSLYNQFPLSMKNYSGGTMSYAAQDHHIYRVDKRVRLEDHRIWKEGALPSPDAKIGSAEFR